MSLSLDLYDVDRYGIRNSNMDKYLLWKSWMDHVDPTVSGKVWPEQVAVNKLWNKQIDDLEGKGNAFNCPDKENHLFLCAYYEVMERKVVSWV